MHLWRLTFEPLDVVHICWSQSSLPALWVQTPTAAAHNEISRSNCWIIPLDVVADQQRWSCHTAAPHDPANYTNTKSGPLGFVYSKYILYISSVCYWQWNFANNNSIPTNPASSDVAICSNFIFFLFFLLLFSFNRGENVVLRRVAGGVHRQSN